MEARHEQGREQAMTTIHDSNERTTTAVTVRAERARLSEHGDEWADNLERNHGPFTPYDQTAFGQTLARVFDQGGDELARQRVRTV
jgi:hypothetical protein